MIASPCLTRIFATGRVGFMVFALLLCALLTSASVHAQEQPGQNNPECSISAQAGTADDVSMEDGKAVLHGACHGPAVYLAERIGPMPRLFPILDVRVPERMTSLVPRSASPDLRPPKS